MTQAEPFQSRALSNSARGTGVLSFAGVIAAVSAAVNRRPEVESLVYTRRLSARAAPGDSGDIFFTLAHISHNIR